jgi:branched-chain amino acid transport system ATP-binding protein/urea transport system ATP-binding protein
VLTIRDLVAGYHASSEVLRALSLDIAEGEIVALMGRNGMGKSTLLKAIMGHISIRTGTIRFRERELVGLRPFEISNLGIAYVPQGREIFQAFTVEENLILGVLGKRHLAAEVPQRLYAWFPILEERRWQRGGTMSGGEQQQLAIARALIGRPRLLLLDEPSEGIQPSTVQALGTTLGEIAVSERLSILLVEQNLDLVTRIAARCLFIENGRLVDAAEPARLRADPSLLQRYLSV